MRNDEDPRADEAASPRSDLDSYLPYLIHRLGAWTSPRRALRRADGKVIRLREWRMLLVIAAHGRLTGADVGYLTGMDSGSTTRAVQALIDDKLIVSDVCTQDRRRSWLTLTPLGVAVHAELASRRMAYNERLLSVLSPSERDTLLTSLHRLQKHAEALDGIEAAEAE